MVTIFAFGCVINGCSLYSFTLSINVFEIFPKKKLEKNN